MSNQTSKQKTELDPKAKSNLQSLEEEIETQASTSSHNQITSTSSALIQGKTKYVPSSMIGSRMQMVSYQKI